MHTPIHTKTSIMPLRVITDIQTVPQGSITYSGLCLLRPPSGYPDYSLKVSQPKMCNSHQNWSSKTKVNVDSKQGPKSTECTTRTTRATFTDTNRKGSSPYRAIYEASHPGVSNSTYSTASIDSKQLVVPLHVYKSNPWINTFPKMPK